jgi:cell division transport system permease protein
MALRPDYLFREVTSGLRRNGLVAFAAVSTTFIALLLFGLALLISRQVNLMIEQTTGNVEVAVYLSDPVNDETVAALTDRLHSLEVVDNVSYETKAQACERFKEIFEGQEALTDTVDCNELPASLRVKMNDPEQFRQVAAVLGCNPGGLACGQPGIDRVVDQSQFLDRLFSITRIFRVGVLMVSILMLLSAAVLIANTVRMGLYARRKEIGIMKLVGATNWRIRLPFLIEGLAESLIGATLAVLVLFGLKVWFVNPLYPGGREEIPFVPWIDNSDVLIVIPWLFIAGAVVAVIAGFVGMRRFLDV